MANCPNCGSKPSDYVFDNRPYWTCRTWKRGEGVLEKSQSQTCRIRELEQRNEKLEKRLTVAVKALEWYEDKQRWKDASSVCRLLHDSGQVARDALKEIKEFGEETKR